MNSWTNARPGGWLPSSHDGRFAIYRAHFTPRAVAQKTGANLHLRDVVGKAQVWIDGKMVGEKTVAEKQDITVAFLAGDGERTVSVLIEAEAAGTRAGLGGSVTVE
jgi:beta-galactosidase